jgi:hypothetical protein
MNMRREFNRFGKPLPNKSEVKYLKFVDKVIRLRLGDYIVDEFNDDDIYLNITDIIDSGYYSDLGITDIYDLAEYIVENGDIKDNLNNSLYYIFLKNTMKWFFKDCDYESVKKNYYSGLWEKGWVPDIITTLGLDFEESYAILLMWLNNELKKYGTTINEIERSINR